MRKLISSLLSLSLLFVLAACNSKSSNSTPPPVDIAVEAASTSGVYVEYDQRGEHHTRIVLIDLYDVPQTQRGVSLALIYLNQLRASVDFHVKYERARRRSIRIIDDAIAKLENCRIRVNEHRRCYLH